MPCTETERGRCPFCNSNKAMTTCPHWDYRLCLDCSNVFYKDLALHEKKLSDSVEQIEDHIDQSINRGTYEHLDNLQKEIEWFEAATEGME